MEEETKEILSVFGAISAGIIFIVLVIWLMVILTPSDPPNPFTDCMNECNYLSLESNELTCKLGCQEKFADDVAQYYREVEDE